MSQLGRAKKQNSFLGAYNGGSVPDANFTARIRNSSREVQKLKRDLAEKRKAKQQQLKEKAKNELNEVQSDLRTVDDLRNKVRNLTNTEFPQINKRAKKVQSDLNNIRNKINSVISDIRKLL